MAGINNSFRGGRSRESRSPRLEKPSLKYGPSTVAVLKVVRQSEMGAFLDAETGNTNDDILLHRTQQTSDVQIGDMVKVFLYLDPKHRLTASMRVPKLKEGQIARMRVINVSKDGAFLDVGAERGIFMPYAGMRGKLQIGEVVWAKLYTDKSGRLAVTMKVEDEMRRASVRAENVRVGQKVKGSVYNITDRGAFMLTNERYIVFIANKEMVEKPRVGQELEARVTYIRPDGRLNASLREAKEKARISDSDKVLMFLQSNDGRMPYSDSSSPELIKGKFKISKAAFKRAIGRLYKDGLIEMRDGWTYLK
ncbi:MAG: S1-like domain-containing RNA-binding protein [Anaerovibrio sp.]|nr:S1-like domain-containing RNA-binding protein [Anaerovibrio sp.]